MIKQTIYFIVFLILLNTVSAKFIYITPEELSFNNVLVGGYAEQTITITTDSDVPLHLTPVIAGDIKSWVSFEPDLNLYVKENVPLSLKVIIQPPEDSAIGKHSGEIVLIFQNEQAPLIGKEQESSFAIKTTVTLTYDKIKKLVISEIKAKDAEVDYPVDFIIDGENIGNQELIVDLEVLMNDRGLIQKETLNPTEQKDVLLSLSSDNLTVGRYSARVTVYLDGSLIKQENVSFGIRNKNTLIRKGNLLDIRNQGKIAESDEIIVEAIFKNTGEVSVDCMFRAEILKDSELLSELESDQYYCLTDKTTILPISFINLDIGVYQIIGKVYYDSTVSDEIESFVEIIPYSEIHAVPLSISPYFAFMLVIIILLITRVILRKKIKQEIKPNGN